MNLKAIFDAITPENIKDIPLIKTAMEIFIANLEENAKVATDIKEIYNNISKDTDSAIIKRTKDELRANLLDVYLGALYKILAQAQTNTALKQKLETQQLTDIPFVNDINKILNDEYFVTNKSFKEKIGTKTGVKYAYNLTKYLESAENIANDMKLYEVKPFHFKTDGSIFKEMYENIVKPMAHPLGFTYTYSQIIKESLTDLFGVIISYKVNRIEVRDITGYIDVFTSDPTDANIAIEFTQRVNSLTNKLFTLEEYNKYVTVHTNKVVDTFVDTKVDDRIFRSFLFTDDTYLEQYTNPIVIKYMQYSDFVQDNDVFIKSFGDHSSVFVDYTSDVTFEYSDNIDQFITELYITKIKENNGGNYGQQYFNLTSGIYAFHVGGDAYNFAPGLDETHGAYDDSNLITNEINDKFNVTIYGNTSVLETLIEVKLVDKYGNVLLDQYVTSDANGDFATVFNTYPLHGKEYTITATVAEHSDVFTHRIKTTGLNDFVRTFCFTSVEDWNHVTSNTLRAVGNGPIGKTVYVTLTDSANNTISSTVVVGVNGTWESIIPLANKVAGAYKIECVIYDALGKVEYTTFFEGSDLRTYRENIKIKVLPFVYIHGAPNYSGMLGYHNVTSPNNMDGINSTSSLILKQIGELSVDNTYAADDKELLAYMIANGYTTFDQLPRTIHTEGSYIEGNDYLKTTFDYLTEEETFINFGRKVYPIDTSDAWVITSNDYCVDDVLLYPFSSSGYYLHSSEYGTEDFYLYTTDTFYLNTLADAV